MAYARRVSGSSPLFAFEADFQTDLRCIPMSVRYKLDLVGIKMSLKEWVKLGPDLRAVALALPGEADLPAFAAAIDEMVLEIPAGKRDVVGEPPETTARRELIEEVGLAPGRLERLARFHNSIGFCDEESHVFLGTELTEAPMDRQGIEEAHMDIVHVALADTAAMIAAGEITDAKTVIGLTLALARTG